MKTNVMFVCWAAVVVLMAALNVAQRVDQNNNFNECAKNFDELAAITESCIENGEELVDMVDECRAGDSVDGPALEMPEPKSSIKMMWDESEDKWRFVAIPEPKDDN
jgi:hypothetical protein